MNIKKITIPDYIRNTIQRYDNEQTAIKEIIGYISSHNYNISNERYVEYEKNFYEKFIIFNKLKKELEELYVIPNIDNNKNYTWYLDYLTSTLIITLQD